jgi:hypothetical protein
MWAAPNLRPESIWITLQCSFNSFTPGNLILRIIKTVGAVAPITVSTRSKAFTVPVKGTIKRFQMDKYKYIHKMPSWEKKSTTVHSLYLKREVG